MEMVGSKLLYGPNTQKQVPCKEYDARGSFVFKSDCSIETDRDAADDGSETISKVTRVQSREEHCALSVLCCGCLTVDQNRLKRTWMSSVCVITLVWVAHSMLVSLSLARGA